MARKLRLNGSQLLAVVARLAPEMTCPDAKIVSAKIDTVSRMPIERTDGQTDNEEGWEITEFWATKGTSLKRLTPKRGSKATLQERVTKRRAQKADLILVFQRRFAKDGTLSRCSTTAFPNEPSYWEL